MISRVISLLLIATVIGCPLRCGNPLLGLLSVSTATSGETLLSETPAPRRSCCGHCAPQQHESSSSEPVSDDAVCQCFCAGAVLTDQVLLTDSSEALSYSAVVPELSSAVSITEPNLDRTDPGPTGSTNYGRLLRTLRMSFLC